MDILHTADCADRAFGLTVLFRVALQDEACLLQGVVGLEMALNAALCDCERQACRAEGCPDMFEPCLEPRLY